MTTSTSLVAGIRRHALAAGLTAALGLAAAVPAQAVTYTVSINTASFAGTSGSVDLQWNVAGIAPGLTASVFGFTGPTLVGSATTLGGSDVAGSFASTLLFGGSQLYSYTYQTVTFGSSVSFKLTLPDSAPAVPAATGGSVFLVSILDGAALPLLAADPFSDASLMFDVQAGAKPVVNIYSTAITVSAVTAAIPEPSTYALSLLGLVAIGAYRRRASRAKQAA